MEDKISSCSLENRMVYIIPNTCRCAVNKSHFTAEKKERNGSAHQQVLIDLPKGWYSWGGSMVEAIKGVTVSIQQSVIPNWLNRLFNMTINEIHNVWRGSGTLSSHSCEMITVFSSLATKTIIYQGKCYSLDWNKYINLWKKAPVCVYFK